MKADARLCTSAFAQSVLPKKGFFVRIRQRNWARPLAARPSYGRLLPALNA
jgi:hypothetical protein